MQAETFQAIVTQYGYPSLFGLLTVGILGIPVPDETLLIFSGYLVFKGDLKAVPTHLVAFLGSACGITLSYLIGRTLGLKLVLKYGSKVRVTPAHLDRVHAWFDRLGKWTLLIGYFLPGIRHFTAIVAGTSRLRMSTFGVFAYAGAFIWSFTFISLGRLLGDAWVHATHHIRMAMIIGSITIILSGLAFFIIRRQRRSQT